MQTSIEIAEDLKLPLSAVTQTFAFLARRGSGKSYALDVVIEGMSRAGSQVVVIDPTDVHWGLRSGANGNSPGYPFVVFGGNHADIPLTDGSGKILAEFVVESKASVIICTRLMSKSKSRALMADFFEHIYSLKGKPGNQTPLFVAIDECDLFVPQFVEGDVARCVGAIDDIVRRGRTSGIGVALVSQRAAKVNKDVLSQVEVLVALQTAGTHDRKALKEWVEANADTEKMQEFIENLVKLQRGEAWVWSPSWLKILQRIKFKPKLTFDSGCTPTSDGHGNSPRVVAKVDLDAVRQKMSAVIEKSKTENPKELRSEIVVLRRRVADLNRQLMQKPPVQPRVVERPVALTTDISRIEKLVEKASVALDKASEALRTTQQVSQDLARTAGIIRNPAKDISAANGPSVAFRKYNRVNPDLGPKTALQVGTRGATGHDMTPAKPDVVLRTMGLVEYRSDRIALTPSGEMMAYPPEIAITTKDLHESVLRVLPGPEQRILKPLLDTYPQDMTKEDLAAASGYTVGAGAFNNPCGRLRSLGLIDYPRPGACVASHCLFIAPV